MTPYLIRYYVYPKSNPDAVTVFRQEVRAKDKEHAEHGFQWQHYRNARVKKDEYVFLKLMVEEVRR